jgi:hypothetical protein
MDKKVIRIYYSGYLEREIPKGTTDDGIHEMRLNLWDAFTKQEIEKCITEDDWAVLPRDSLKR